MAGKPLVKHDIDTVYATDTLIVNGVPISFTKIPDRKHR